jgi:hypothetical protein
MSPVIKQILKHKLVLMLVIIALFLTATSIGAASGPKHSTSAIHTITPMTEISTYNPNVNAADYFDVVGILNSIDGNKVIIGDRQLTLAPGVSTYGLSQYNLVGANLDSAGSVVALELISDKPN